MPRLRKERGERKIEKSETGRVYWKAGEAHPLDVLYSELDELRAQLPEQLKQLLTTASTCEERLRTILAASQKSDDPMTMFSQAEKSAHTAIFERFKDRKHYSHLQAIFALRRQQRLAGRLKTAAAALQLANGLLEGEESFAPEALAAWRQAQHTPEPEEEQPSQEHELEPQEPAGPPLTKEEKRVQGINEPLTAIAGNVERSRQLLRDFEAQLPELRKQLLVGQGWFEVFEVPKRHYKKQILDYAKALQALNKHKTPIPEEISKAIHPQVARLIRAGADKFPPELRDEIYDIVYVGPYVKYRWTEDGRTYSISLGLDDDYPPFPFVPEGF